MSSSIHYKFRATLEAKTLGFEGLSILAADLKREICTKENIKAEAFDLKLTNAHTKREYAADEQIPRNSSIIVQRVPKEDGEKLPKIQGVNTGMVQRNDPSSSSSLSMTTHIPQSIFNKMTEEERLKHIKDISSSAYDPSNYQKRPSGALTGLPPPTYTCNRCHQPGHWYKLCPLLNQKRTTGIPSQELMETTADDPQAMLHPSGKYVIPIMHWKARQHKKNVEENPVQEKIIPKMLLCPQCEHLFKDAVITPCCGISFCAECISQRLLESEERNCPGCKKAQLSLDSLVPNTNLRQCVANWEAGSGPTEVHERVRIGLAPSSNPPSTTSLTSAGLSPSINTPRPAVQASVPIATNPPPPGTQAPSVLQQPTAIPIPTSFTQPPPNMMMIPPPTEMLVPPGTTPHIPTLASVPIIPSALPPIPGVQAMDSMYRQSPISVNNGQFMEAWEAYLNRNDKNLRRDRERDYRERRRKRSRDRHRSRSISEDRKRSRRDRRDRSDRRDKDRDRSRERHKKRDYDSKDSRRSNRKRDFTDENIEKEEMKQEKQAASSSKDEMEIIDEEEAAIDDALKEVESMKMLNTSDKVDIIEVDNVNISKDDEPEEKNNKSDSKISERQKSFEPENFIESQLEQSPRDRRSSDSTSTAHEKSENEKSERDMEKRDKSDTEREKSKKEKKSKKLKKEKKHKKDKDETEEERKERKRLKKEKKEKKKRDKENEKDRRDKRDVEREDERISKRDRKGSEPEREHKKKEDKHREKDRRDEKSKDAGKNKDKSRHHEDRLSKREKETTPKEKSDSKKSENESKHRSEKLSGNKDDYSKAVVDEKQIRDHFSPPPVLLQNKKITLNI